MTFLYHPDFVCIQNTDALSVEERVLDYAESVSDFG